MKRAVFDPNVHGLFVWPETRAAEAMTALEALTIEMKVRYPDAQFIPGACAIYAMRDELIAGVAWIEPEMHEGRVVGIERFIGTIAGSA